MSRASKHFDLIMIVTHQDNSNISKFIYSVCSNYYINLFVIVVSQVEFMFENTVSGLTEFKQLHSEKKSLSAARNYALNFLNDNKISASYLMFPDDDSSFDMSFFVNFSRVKSSNFNFITPIYNNGTNNLYLGKKMKSGVEIISDNYNLIGSPNQIIKYSDFKNHIYFDTQLGVGARYGSCEDLDLFLRLNFAGAKFIYTNELYSFHPEKTSIYHKKSFMQILSRFKSYSSGFAIIIFRYNFYKWIPNYLFRTIAGSIVFLFRLNLKLSLAYFFQFFMRVYLIGYFFLKK
jgi:hypothetical protein